MNQNIDSDFIDSQNDNLGSFSQIEIRPILNSDKSIESNQPKSCCEKICDFIKNNWKLMLLVVFIVMIMSVLALPPVQNYIKKMVTTHLVRMRNFQIKNEGLTYAITFGIVFAMTFVFPRLVPNIVIAFILKDFWPVLIVMYVSLQMAICIGYFSVNYCCYKSWHDKLQGNENLEVLDAYSKESPWTCSWIVWALLLPLPVKIFGFPLTGIRFLPYFIPSCFCSMAWSVLFTMIGSSLRNLVLDTSISDLGSKKALKKLSNSQIAETAITTILIIATGIFLLCLYKIWNVKKQELKERHKHLEFGQNCHDCDHNL